MFDIYVDSGANIPDEIIERHNLNVIPFMCSIDGVETACYEKGRPSREMAVKFYAAMRAGSNTSTSLINSEKFLIEITPSLESGRDVIITTLSSGISGTFKQACEAAEQAEAKYPGRRVHVFDAYNASMGEGLFAVYAARGDSELRQRVQYGIERARKRERRHEHHK